MPSPPPHMPLTFFLQQNLLDVSPLRSESKRDDLKDLAKSLNMDKEWLNALGGDGQLDFLEAVHKEQEKLGNTKAGKVLAFSTKGASKALGSLGQDDDDEDFFGSFAVKDDSDDEMLEVPKGSVVQDTPSQSNDAHGDPAGVQADETPVVQPDERQLDDCADKQPPTDRHTTPPTDELASEPIQGIPKDQQMSKGLVMPMDIDALGGQSGDEELKGPHAPSPITKPAAHEEPQTASPAVVHSSASAGQDLLHASTPAEHEQGPAPMETEHTDVPESHGQAGPASNPASGEATVNADAAEPECHQNTSREAMSEADPGPQHPTPTPILPCSPKPNGMPTLAQAGGETPSPICKAPAMGVATGEQLNNFVSAATRTPPHANPCSEDNSKLPQDEVPQPTAPQPADLQSKLIPDANRHLSASEHNGKDPSVSVGIVDAGMHLASPSVGSTQVPTTLATSSSPLQNPSKVFVQPLQFKAVHLPRIAQPVLPRPLLPHVAPVRTPVVLPKDARPIGLLSSRPTFLTAQPRSRLQHVGTTVPASVQSPKGNTSPRLRIAAPPAIPHKKPYATEPISSSAGQPRQPQRRASGTSTHRIFPAQTPLPSRRELPVRCPETRHASPTTVLQQGSVAAMPTPVVNKQPSSIGHVNIPKAPPANTFSSQARVSESPTIPVQPKLPPATVETAVPGPLILRRETSHLKPVSAQLSEETRKLNQMLLQAEQMHDEAMALRVRVAIHGNRLARLDNPVLLDALSSLKQRADELMAQEE